MGLDIVIPLAKDKRTNYYELRMTLRSIEKNLTGYRNIIIIGERPTWITNIIHIPLPDIAGKKMFLHLPKDDDSGEVGRFRKVYLMGR